MDLNNDGRDDLLIGTGHGYVNYYTRKDDGTLHSEGHMQAGGADIKAEFESSVAVVDWNGNGLLDLLVGVEEQPLDARYGFVRLYLNKGTANSPSFSNYSEISGGGWSIRARYPMLELADVNYDGKRDLIIGCENLQFNGEYVLYLNSGSNNASAFSQSSYSNDKLKLQYKGDGGSLKDISKKNAMMPFLGDINGDGCLDLLSGGVRIVGLDVYYGSKK